MICKHGERRPGKATVTLERKGMMLVVKNVPALVCGNCGEEYVDDTTAHLLKEAEEAARAGVQVDVREDIAAWRRKIKVACPLFCFSVQLLHGSRLPPLRTPNTLEALNQLVRAGTLSAKAGETLREAYLYLRSLIDALRIVRGHAKDLVLPESGTEEFTFLSRRMGYGQRDWEKGKKRLEEAIRHHMTGARKHFLSVTEKALKANGKIFPAMKSGKSPS